MSPSWWRPMSCWTRWIRLMSLFRPASPVSILLLSALLLLLRPLLGFCFCFLPFLPSVFLVPGLVLQQASAILI